MMSRALSSHVVPAILGLILFAVTMNSIETGRIWYARNVAAIEWQGVEVMTQKVHTGGTLTIEYTAVINKQCPADLRGFIVAADDTVPVRFPVVAGGYSKPSESPVKIRVSVTVPKQSDPGLAPLRSGPHVYRTLATRYCPDGVEEDAAIPDAPFMLEVGP
jgi:hypothetical protein